jgi:hypothetical protein
MGIEPTSEAWETVFALYLLVRNLEIDGNPDGRRRGCNLASARSHSQVIDLLVSDLKW